MISKTKRKVGKGNHAEILAFQKRYGLHEDGLFGNQCMGQVLEIEKAYDDEHQAYLDLKTSPKAPVSFWDWLFG